MDAYLVNVPLRARIVFRAKKHLEALIENIYKVMNHKILS